MKTEGRRQSENVEDRRGQGGRFPGGRAGAGGGLGLVVIVVLALVFGVDPSQLISGMEGAGGPGAEQQSGPYQETPEEAQRSAFVRVVLADTEDVWKQVFTGAGQTYRLPTLVLFRGAVQSACGNAQSAMGPFYCPSDQKVYLDLSFYDDMAGKLGAKGDFAFAYVVAHEVGHHVQTLLGTSAQVQQQRARASEAEGNELSVRQELQADCYAGVWAHHTEKQKKVLEAGDIEEAMNAAAAVGDDRLQQRGQGYVVPESFTHGTSAQRAKWFNIGLKSGAPDQCDTFGAADF
ncbi:MAG: neutral zinc metallopeptidase [Alphaproteobacteria bacterium]|jgi:predicted metalloprotease|nr:neutral zinc metallopeptidase [Alphaproteobacteria bacterium]